MSGPNFIRNPSITCHQVNSQKTLIYDLRSQLSNLKNQFSRLISKPTDNPSKSKIESKPPTTTTTITKSRYSYADSESDTNESQVSASGGSGSYYQMQGPGLGLRTTEVSTSPRLNFTRTEGGDKKNGQPVFERYSQNYRKSSNQECIGVGDGPVSLDSQRKLLENKKIDPDSAPAPLIKKTQQFGGFYKKFHGSSYELGDKPSSLSKVSNKTTEISSEAMCQQNYLEQLRAAQQKIRRLEEQNQQQTLKIANFAQKIEETQRNSSTMERQIQELGFQNGRKDEKIGKLEQQIRQLAQRASKANEQTMQISREKNREMDLIRQGHASQLKNQQKDFQKRLLTQKQNYQLRSQSQLASIKSSYESKLVLQCQQIQKLKTQLISTNQKLQKSRIEMAQLERSRPNRQSELREKIGEIGRQKDRIANLEGRVGELELQLTHKPKPIEKQKRQFGINTDVQKKEPISAPVVVQPPPPAPATATVQPQPQPQAPTTTTTTNNTNTSEPQKSLQDKLTIYLNNIDKQSQKIKQQKAQLQKSQRALQDNNRLICQKEATIRNLMRDCKAMEKELTENRRMRREMEVLLEDANVGIGLMILGKLNKKYEGL